MKRVAIFGNSGGGKSTLVRRLAELTGLARGYRPQRSIVSTNLERFGVSTMLPVLGPADADTQQKSPMHEAAQRCDGNIASSKRVE
jgi:hypothetical protein